MANLHMPLPQNNYTQPKKTHRLATLIGLLVWFAVIGGLFVNRQNIVDWWKLRNYHPPAAVAELATQDNLTDFGRKVFYVNYPVIHDKKTFASSCPNNGGEQTIILGCYHGVQNGIDLLSVSDNRLTGVVQVTAAHEMLHAAYDRLSSSDQKKVDAMLLDYYQHGLHDQRIMDTIDAYKKSEPKDIVNEMHSIFGTEIAQLPAGLEQYYKRYFNNRSVVAAFAAHYQEEFSSRQAAVKQDDIQLDALKTQIDSGEADLKTMQDQINSAQTQLEAKRSAGDIAGYNALVPTFNALVRQFNGEVTAVQDLINQYNKLVDERNAIAIEQQQLANDLSTKAIPVKQ